MQGSNLQIVLYELSYRHVFFHLHPSCPAAILNDSSVIECVKWRVMLQRKNNGTNAIVRALLVNTALSTTNKLNDWSCLAPTIYKYSNTMEQVKYNNQSGSN